MSDIRSFFEKKSAADARIALCLSGTGSNARVLLHQSRLADAGFEVAVLFTDQPETSAAEKLAAEYNIPCESLDIRQFYAGHGESEIKLDTPRRRELRNLWSGKVWEILQPYHCDFAVFAGFIPLNDLPDKLPCLNVHPGDLTVEKNGERIYAGLHYLPVERAICNGENALRSSVILVPGFSQSQVIDGGPVLGISAPVKIDLGGAAVEELQKIRSFRSKGPYNDKLREVAKNNVETLKTDGDHVVMPQVVKLFAAGRYGSDAENNTFFKDDSGNWQQIVTLEVSREGFRLIYPEKTAVQKPLKKKSLKRFFRYLYIKMVRENGSPDYIARGWSLGVFVGCVVPVFCQLVVAIPLSFIFRCSKIGAALGTFITTPPTAIFVYPVLIWAGNKVINGNLAAGDAKRLLDIFNSDQGFVEKWQAFADTGGSLVAAFFAGGLLWALVMTPLTYFFVRYLVIRYRKMREALRKRAK